MRLLPDQTGFHRNLAYFANPEMIQSTRARQTGKIGALKHMCSSGHKQIARAETLYSKISLIHSNVEKYRLSCNKSRIKPHSRCMRQQKFSTSSFQQSLHCRWSPTSSLQKQTRFVCCMLHTNSSRDHHRFNAAASAAMKQCWFLFGSGFLLQTCTHISGLHELSILSPCSSLQLQYVSSVATVLLYGHAKKPDFLLHFQKTTTIIIKESHYCQFSFITDSLSTYCCCLLSASFHTLLCTLFTSFMILPLFRYSISRGRGYRSYFTDNYFHLLPVLGSLFSGYNQANTVLRATTLAYVPEDVCENFAQWQFCIVVILVYFTSL